MDEYEAVARYLTEVVPTLSKPQVSVVALGIVLGPQEFGRIMRSHVSAEQVMDVQDGKPVLVPNTRTQVKDELLAWMEMQLADYDTLLGNDPRLPQLRAEIEALQLEDK